MNIKTYEQLEKVFTENSFFHDYQIIDISKNNNTLRLHIKHQLSGSYWAGEKAIIRESCFSFDKDSEILGDYEHWNNEGYTEELMCFLSNDKMIINIKTPNEILVTFNSCKFEYSDTEIIVPNSFSFTELSVEIPQHKLFAPSEIIEFFKSEIDKICWRYYFGEEVDSKNVPLDYTGWFFQKRDRLKINTQGIFIFSADNKNKISKYHFRLNDLEIQNSFISFITSICKIEQAIIISGNKKINAKDFIKVIEKDYHPTTASTG